jgi:hypothetical protein
VATALQVPYDELPTLGTLRELVGEGERHLRDRRALKLH